MTNYYVKFCYVDDTYYSSKYDKQELEIMLKEINKLRFITLPDDLRILNLDHIIKIDIENITK